MVRNNVFVNFAAGTEFSGSTVRLIITCRFQAGFPGFPIPGPDEFDDDEVTLERIGGDDNEYDNYDSSHDDDNSEVSFLSLGVSTSRPIEIEIENVLSVETSF
jgi:hypothetical protein